MISRGRSASPFIIIAAGSATANHSDDYKDLHLLSFLRAIPLALLHFPFFPFLHALRILSHFEGTYILKISARHSRVVLHLFFHVVVVVVVHRFFFSSYFSLFVLIWNRAKRECASRRKCVQTYRTKRKRVKYPEKIHNEGRVSAVQSITITFYHV